MRGRGVFGGAWLPASDRAIPAAVRAARALGQGPAGSLLSMSAALVVGASALFVMHNVAGSEPALNTDARPHYLQPAEPRVPRVVSPAPLPADAEPLTVYIVHSVEDAEFVQARIDDENRTQDVLQRPQVNVRVLVALSAEDETRFYHMLSEIGTMRSYFGHAPIEIIDVLTS